MSIRILVMAALIACAMPCAVYAGGDPETAVQASDQLPKLPKGQVWQMMWSDDFNGADINATKWEAVDGDRRGHLWRGANAYLDGKGFLVMETSKVGDQYASPCLRTRGKYEKAFGYFEVRCKLPMQEGHWAAFWTMNDAVGTVGNEGRDGTEIDIMEWPYRDGRVQHALHWDGYGDSHKTDSSAPKIPALLDGEFHKFALWWTPTEYIFYVDGTETWRTSAGGVCQNPVYLKLSVEIGDWAGDITKATLPDHFIVDYVRVYDPVKE